MLVDFDVKQNKLKKDDLLIWDGKRFDVIALADITSELKNTIAGLEHEILLHKQTIEKLKTEQLIFIDKIKNKLPNIVYEIIEEVAKRWGN